MASFDLVLRTRGSLHPSGEPTDFVSEYDGIITCTNDETGKAVNVGRVRALKVHAALAAERGESLFDVCDAHSAELHEIHTLLYEPGGHAFRDVVAEKFDAFDWDLLLIDHVVLSPKWRGLRLGLLAIRQLVDLVGGGCGLAVSFIAPLRRGAHKEIRVSARWLPASKEKESKLAARVALRRYYRTMGFRRLGRTGYYALPLGQQTPSPIELLRPRGEQY